MVNRSVMMMMMMMRGMQMCMTDFLPCVCMGG